MDAIFQLINSALLIINIECFQLHALTLNKLHNFISSNVEFLFLTFFHYFLIMIRTREDLSYAQRIIIKAGTGVVSTPDGYPSLTRMAAIVEAASKLVKQGKEVIVVTSGAVGVGKQILKKQAILKHTVLDVLTSKEYVD